MTDRIAATSYRLNEEGAQALAEKWRGWGAEDVGVQHCHGSNLWQIRGTVLESDFAKFVELNTSATVHREGGGNG